MQDRYTDRSFDPASGTGSTLVASFDGSRPASTVALTVEERDFFDSRENRDLRSLMNQRTGVCG